MPVKRRRDKARKQLDTMDMQDLFYGPGTCLFNGEGYLGPHGDGRWNDKPEDVKAAVLEAMRQDWHRHSAVVLEAWQNRTPHDHYIAEQFHGGPAEPWALQTFGEPQCQ